MMEVLKMSNVRRRPAKESEVKYAEEQHYTLISRCGYKGHLLGEVTFSDCGASLSFLWNRGKEPMPEDISKTTYEMFQSIMLFFTNPPETLKTLLSKESKYGDRYIHRIDIYGSRFSYLLSVIPETLNVDLYVYTKDVWDKHMEKAKNGIEFIERADKNHPGNRFFLKDGGMITYSILEPLRDWETIRHDKPKDSVCDISTNAMS